MAGAPPRRESLGSLGNTTCSKQRSSLETLMAMGFSRKRAEKAIAASGNKGVNFASEWLLSHVNDPTIDEVQSREYVIYLCPTGEFLAQLIQFWQKSKKLGWNSALVYHPHITLCPFFPMADNKVNVIDKVMAVVSNVLKEWYSFNYSFGLDLDTKNKSFIGLFVSRQIHQLVEDLMMRIQLEFRKHGVNMDLHKKQLHMTLAFQYNMENQEKLMEMAQAIRQSHTTSWEVRVYSRDASQKDTEVRRIFKDYQPEQGDELALCVEDYVLMDPREHEKSLDGWYRGTSYLTGAVGFFPGNFTELCSKMDTWTLHRAVEFKSNARNFANGAINNSDFLIEKIEGDNDYDNLWVTPPPDVYTKVNKQKKQEDVKEPLTPRKMFVVRHAQRCDFSYKSWFDRSFDDKGFYKRFDLNCPPLVCPRKSFRDYSKDAPLTEIGKAQALITGEGLCDSGETIMFIYASPSLRCVQTATQIIKGLNHQGMICVEPGLFEWCGWCREGMPTFMTEEEFIQAGFPVDPGYVPYIRTSQLQRAESVEMYYNRSFRTTQHVIRRHSAQRGNILLVGHSGSMDACTRQLRGKSALTTDTQLLDVVRGCPYCSLCAAIEDPVTESWDLCQPPIPPLTHGGNREYDWTTMKT